MKNVKLNKSIYSIFAMGVFLIGCKEKTEKKNDTLALANTETSVKTPKKETTPEFNKYWYSGTAEITSYKLEQARYGEIRKGTSVMIYVTEPFLPELQVKADNNDKSNIPVLKLNTTKNFITGIYPYTIMTSSFYPVQDNQHAIKLAFSSQEWCGQAYTQLNNKADFEIMGHSYIGSAADQVFHVEKANLENEIWNKIRINPAALPIGDTTMIPSLEFLRLNHKELKAYKATAAISEANGIKTYEINYPALNRTLQINFKAKFPFSIESWTDTYKDGWGKKAKILTSKGTKNKRLKTPYWKQNSNKDLYLRDSLGL